MITYPDLLPKFRQAAAQHQDLLPTLQAVLPEMIAVLPGAQVAKVYRQTPEGLMLRVTTQADAVLDVIYPPEQLPRHNEALQMRQPRVNAMQQSLVVPLVWDNTAEAVLEVVFDVRAEDSLEWLAALAEQLSLALENQSQRTILQRLTSAITQLSHCTSYVEVADVLGKTLARQGQFVSINVFELDEKGDLAGMRILASANRNKAYSAQIQQPVSPTTLEIYAAMMRDTDGVLLLDTQNENRIDADLKNWLKTLGIKSLYLVPMRTGGQITGYIAINDTQRALLYTQLEKQMLHTLAEQAAVVVQNQQYVEEIRASEAESRQQVRVLELLNELSAAANTEQNEQHLLDKTAYILVEATHFDQCGIALLDPDSKYATVRSVYPDSGVLGMKIEVGTDSVAAILRQTKQPLAVSDVRIDERLTPQTRQLLNEAGTLSALFFPIYDAQQQLIGTVGLDSRHFIQEFDPEIIHRAATIVAQVGINLQKIRLIDDSRRQAVQMQRITAFSQAVQSRLEVVGIIQTTIEHVPQIITPLDYLGVLIFNPLTGLLDQMAVWYEQQAHVFQPGQSIGRDDNIVAWTAWDNQTFIAIDDIRNSPKHIHPKEHLLRTIVVAPVIAGGNSHGLLEVGASVPFAYSASDIAAVQQISNQVGVALENAAAFTYSQEEAEQKALAGRITALLQKQVDLESILTVTARELGKALGAKRARIRMGLQPPENGNHK